MLYVTFYIPFDVCRLRDTQRCAKYECINEMAITVSIEQFCAALLVRFANVINDRMIYTLIVIFVIICTDVSSAYEYKKNSVSIGCCKEVRVSVCFSNLPDRE